MERLEGLEMAVTGSCCESSWGDGSREEQVSRGQRSVAPPPEPPFLAAPPLVPAVVLDHVGQLDDELALFVLLAALEGVFLRGTGREGVFSVKSELK